jgi:hypothetical protein
MDATIMPDSQKESDTMSENVELPVDLDSLSVDGTVPQVGDQVDCKVSGSVTRVVNKTAYVKPETINDQPLPATPIEPSPDVSEGERLKNLSDQAGSIPGY